MDNSNYKRVLFAIFGIIGTILFFASFLPYLALVVAAVEGCKEGLFGGRYIYGAQAVKTVLIWMSIIPVFPVCFLYELFFYVLYLRKKSVFFTYAVIVTPVIIVASIIMCCIRYNVLEDELIAQSEPHIREYLSEKYGEELSDGIHIEVKEYDYPRFTVFTPVLPEAVYFELSNDRYGDDLYTDDLIEHLRAANAGMKDEFNLYIDEKLGLPQNMHSDSDILSFNLDGFKNGDDVHVLFPTADYRVKNVSIDCDEVNEDTIFAYVSEFGEKWFPAIEGNMYDSVFLDMRYGGDVVCRVQIDAPSANRNGSRAVFVINTFGVFPMESDLNNRVYYLDDMSFIGYSDH